MEKSKYKSKDGKFRVIAVDTFSNEDWVEGDYDTLDLAIAYVKEHTTGKNMLKMHIYDDNGAHRFDAGRF